MSFCSHTCFCTSSIIAAPLSYLNSSSYTVVYRDGPGHERKGETPPGNSDRKTGLWVADGLTRACRFLRSGFWYRKLNGGRSATGSPTSSEDESKGSGRRCWLSSPSADSLEDEGLIRLGALTTTGGSEGARSLGAGSDGGGWTSGVGVGSEWAVCGSVSVSAIRVEKVGTTGPGKRSWTWGSTGLRTSTFCRWRDKYWTEALLIFPQNSCTNLQQSIMHCYAAQPQLFKELTRQHNYSTGTCKFNTHAHTHHAVWNRHGRQDMTA